MALNFNTWACLFLFIFFFLHSVLSSSSQPKFRTPSPLKDAQISSSLEWLEKIIRQTKQSEGPRNTRNKQRQSGNLEQVGQQVKAMAEKVLSCRPIPSITFAIVDKTSSYSFVVQANGTQNYSTSTNYGIGSTSKAFTAFLASQLKDKKLLSFDAPVRTYIPGFGLMNEPGGSVWLTMKDLLTHHSGLPDHGYDPSYVYGTNFTRAELINRMKFLVPSTQIRASWQYSNLGIAAAGLACSNIISSVSKQETDWEEAVVKNIFTPLGMKTSYTRLEDAKSAGNLAQPYIGELDESGQMINSYPADYDVNQWLQIVSPAGGIYSNVEDMSRWIQLYLNNGKYGPSLSNTLLSESSLQNILNPTVSVFPKNGWLNTYSDLTGSNITITRFSYGYCWIIETYRGIRHIWHNGQSSGFNAIVSLLPDYGLGVVMLSNVDGAADSLQSLDYYAMDLLLGLEPWVDESVLCEDVSSRNSHEQKQKSRQEQRDQKQTKSREPTQKQNSKDERSFKIINEVRSNQMKQVSFNLNDYVGVYQHPTYGNVTISLVSNLGSEEPVIGSLINQFKKNQDQEFVGQENGYLFLAYGSLQGLLDPSTATQEGQFTFYGNWLAMPSEVSSTTFEAQFYSNPITRHVDSLSLPWTNVEEPPNILFTNEFWVSTGRGYPVGGETTSNIY